MKNQEINKLSTDELKKNANSLKKDLFNIRFKKVNGQLDNTANVSIIKKDWKSVIVLADYYRIFQVLKNLLSNAIKYSEDNSTIEIQI